MPRRTIEIIPLVKGDEVYQKATPHPVALPRERRPEWLKKKLPSDPNYFALKRLMREKGLHTVCEEANCPNITECWTNRTATFLMLGNICTRACGFCDVISGKPLPLDENEPREVVEAVKALELKHVVITSVNRDDLPDGGAHIYAEVTRLIHQELPGCRVELLIPDFVGNWDALKMVLDAQPEILNHNTETVPRFYRHVRHKARYPRTLELLRRAKDLGQSYNVITKTGVMVGLGETKEELMEVMRDLREVDCDVLTLGQYMRPSPKHLSVERYYTPTEFEELKEVALSLGFKYVESGPLVRSSYHAHQQAPNA
ncbi:lipoyl synthase [Candidatus Chlorohelix sp.]|uniref:lipoyl synthase n=1 Tax=Candidatus Chlorohelix sp. TaxID=3139201 RepID=UPI003060DB3A